MSVFTTKLARNIFFTDALHRFNCGIQRYKEFIAYALSLLCTLHTFGNGVNVGCCYRGGQGVNKKQRKPFKTWINSKNMLHDFQPKNNHMFKCVCFPTGSDLNKQPRITYAWLETCKLISRTLAHTDTPKTWKVQCLQTFVFMRRSKKPQKENKQHDVNPEKCEIHINIRLCTCKNLIWFSRTQFTKCNLKTSNIIYWQVLVWHVHECNRIK